MSFVLRGCGSRWSLKPLRRRDGGETVAESKMVVIRGLAALAFLIVGATGLIGCAQTTGGDQRVDLPSAPSRIPPWEWWRDLSSVASVPDGDRVVMRSSHCPSGCEFDRHSEGDSRFIRVREDGEGVIFSTEGAGAVTRIWMVMGEGISEPFDGAVRLRVRVDGHQRPVVDLPLSDVFSGTSAPFLSPMVADRTTSGGGNISYVPIPFRNGCEITLVGAEASKIWFQVNARLVEDISSLRSFTGEEPLTEFRALLERTGSDPWKGGPFPTVSGSVVLPPGGGEPIANFTGPDVINGIIIRSSRADWGRLGLRLSFDDREPILVPLLDFFGVARANEPAAHSVFFGADEQDDFYLYFPMPFFERATVELMRRPVEGPPWVTVEYAVRRLDAPPSDDAGHFSIQIRDNKDEIADAQAPVIELEGRGSLVGVFASFGPASGDVWDHLERDEQFYIDGETMPSWRGTGIEDFFGGGFYFRGPDGQPHPFTQPLHGAPVVWFFHRAAPVAYRLFLGDAVVFEDGLRTEFEVIPGADGIHVRTVAFFYSARGDDDQATAAPDG